MSSMKTSKQEKDKPLLRIGKVSLTRQDNVILDNVSLSVARNEIVTLIGPNGSGKSTLVKIALGLIKPDSGGIQINAQHQLAYVPQNMSIDETLPMTVSRFLSLHAPENKSGQLEALDKTGASQLINASLHALSGGEMRRVLLARAIILKPDLLILDEPTAGVDISGQAALYALIQDLRNTLACGILLVSHDLHIVMAATDKVVCLNRHLCCSGTPASVSQTPEFSHLFGETLARELAVYHHHHDHEHGLHGEVCRTEVHQPHG